jgi:hypothetical protein
MPSNVLKYFLSGNNLVKYAQWSGRPSTNLLITITDIFKGKWLEINKTVNIMLQIDLVELQHVLLLKKDLLKAEKDWL